MCALSLQGPPENAFVCYKGSVHKDILKEPLMLSRTRRMVTFLFVVALAGIWMDGGRAKAAAKPQVGYGQAACVSYIPRAWGEFRGGTQQSGLAFQDANGTLRFVTNLPCEGTPQVALEIRRSVPNNN